MNAPLPAAQTAAGSTPVGPVVHVSDLVKSYAGGPAVLRGVSFDVERGEMFALLDPRHIIGCVVHAAAQVTAPGVITHTAGRAFMIGELDRGPGHDLPHPG